MPEYSSTTITPSDGVQVPGMNGSTSGNILLSALKSYILSEKGLANGLASLDANGKLTASQLPDLADDVIVVASYSTLPATGTAGKLYITADNNKMYRWDPDLTTPDYVELSVDLSAYATIADLQDGTLEPLISTKSRQDQNGNVIDQTYATKAELAAEESARETEDSRLKSAIEGNSQRIENLEVAVSGSLVQTNILTDPPSMANVRTITNANEILPWAILKRVGARAVSWNQLAKDIETGNWEGSSGTSVSISDGVATYNVTTIYQYARCSMPLISGHTYLIHGYVAHDDTIRIGLGSGANFGTQGVFAEKAGNTSGAFEEFTARGTWTASGTEKYFIIMAMTSNVTQIKFKECVCFDLTTMSMASLTTAQFRSLFPASYYHHNTGEIIPLNPSAFKVVGKQKWDEVWSAKEVDASTGLQSNTTNTRISNDNLIPVFGGEVIYFLSPADVTIYGFDAEGNYIGYANINTDTIGGGYFKKNQAYTVPARMAGFRFMTYSTYGNVYNHDIMCCLNSVTDKTYEEYKETTLDTSFTADYKYVNENCHDYSENVLVNGVMRREEHKGIVGEIDMGDSSLTYQYDSAHTRFRITSALGFKPCAGSDVANVSVLGYLTVDNNTYWEGLTDLVTFINTDTWWFVNHAYTDAGAFKTAMTGRKLRYELASPPTPTLHDPIPNIPCEDGTTITAITPQNDLVNAIDVPSTIAYMTKIGG